VIGGGTGGLVVRDLDSRNGTFVNGERLGAEPRPVRVDDVIQFGRVGAQLQAAQVTRSPAIPILSTLEFDRRLADEADRSLRFERAMAGIAIECTAGSETKVVNEALLRHVRSVDFLTIRAPGRVDVVCAECPKLDAQAVAARMSGSLAELGMPARMGVAVFPGDAPSPERLLLAANVAMRAVKTGEIGVAREAARSLLIDGHEVLIAEPSMVRLFGLVERIATAPMPVLISGETGSGKEVIAAALHAFGPRSQKPLVKINCAAMPENLLESELFGFEKGAFSGAVQAKPGLFEQADGGSLFLDEIGEMALSLQAKLLRVLEDHQVRRLGALKERKVNIRILAATHRDLRALVAEGRFRQDLLFRLDALVVAVPPLRERRREIILMAERFVAEAAKAMGRMPPTLSAHAAAMLECYSWPGNIRELKNVIARAVVMCERETLEPEQLPADLALALEAHPPDPRSHRHENAQQSTVLFKVPDTLPPGTSSLEDELKALEKRRIVEALDTCGGNQTRAAEILKMPRRTLVSKLATLGIEGPRGRRGD
jgi:DNA-binding NtrC family response regulator